MSPAIATRSSPTSAPSIKSSTFMTNSGSDSEGFEALCRELLNQGLTVRFEARGASMSPSFVTARLSMLLP